MVLEVQELFGIRLSIFQLFFIVLLSLNTHFKAVGLSFIYLFTEFLNSS